MPVAPAHAPAIDLLRDVDLPAVDQWNCVCELQQLVGDELNACRHEQDDALEQLGTSGWCYVDRVVANPDLVASCPHTEKHDLRFVGTAHLPADSTRLIVCQDSASCATASAE